MSLYCRRRISSFLFCALGRARSATRMPPLALSSESPTPSSIISVQPGHHLASALAPMMRKGVVLQVQHLEAGGVAAAPRSAGAQMPSCRMPFWTILTSLILLCRLKVLAHAVMLPFSSRFRPQMTVSRVSARPRPPSGPPPSWRGAPRARRRSEDAGVGAEAVVVEVEVPQRHVGGQEGERPAGLAC